MQEIINLYGYRSDVCRIPLTTSLDWTLNIHVHVHNNVVHYQLLICSVLSDRKATISGSVSLFLSCAHSLVSHMHVFCITPRNALYDNVPSSTSEQSRPKSRLTSYHFCVHEVCRVMTPYGLAGGYQQLLGIYCFQLQGRSEPTWERGWLNGTGGKHHRK